mmetsp:Transcript_7942/g.24544  ORF Transcript_7942/g.24544 Transcript_7942/m.24544 type:complete len:407 (+) Transcript_7942:73-1293(+)
MRASHMPSALPTLLLLCPAGAFVTLPPLQAAHVAPRPAAVHAKAGGGLRLLEWIPSQKLLVGTAKFTWTTLWKTMISELAPQSPDGEYVRPAPQRGSGARWPANKPMVAGRYHVYVGNPCPWCHRVSITLALRGLDGAVGLTRLANDPERASRGGWCFDDSAPDPLVGAADLKAVYDAVTPGGAYEGRCTAPLLVDLQDGEIISNESADIIRMLNEFDEPAGSSAATVDLYPAELAAAIDETNAWTYELVNNGVYRCGFATQQAAYEAAERDVHAGLRRCEEALAGSRFLCGSRVSEADVRLLPTVVRFDGVYAPFFRCGRFQVRSDYPRLQRWCGEMLRLTGPGLFDLDDARRGYYTDLFPLNPGGIVPAGPSPADLGWPSGGEAVAERDESAFARKRVAVEAAE